MRKTIVRITVRVAKGNALLAIAIRAYLDFSECRHLRGIMMLASLSIVLMLIIFLSDKECS